MVRSSASAKSLPPLGAALAVVLVAAAAALWLDRGRGAAAAPELGRLMTATQAARAEARGSLLGDTAAVDAVAAARADIGAALAQARASAASQAARELAEAADWQTAAASLDTIAQAGDAIVELHAQREQLLALAPRILAATANLAGAVPAEQLQANQIHLARFELAVQALQQSARALAVPGNIEEAVSRLGDTEQFLGQTIAGLSGTDASLGIAPVTDSAAAGNLEIVRTLFEQARSAIGVMAASADRVAAADAALAELDAAASALLERYRQLDAGAAGAQASRWPLVLVGVAVFLMMLIVLAYYQARDFRRAAQLQAEQNERNQQAILRLLDELSSLADGDLTVQATVTEDITGAIADSINYAIEALRELVATVNDSSILVDSAAKQTEATAHHLVRSAEQQAKQAAAASDSIAKMTASVAEVSGNAERCADVARHAVDVAHKGGEAVRRTIEGMNTIRETIQDTSKRIKRLGESSQEIGNIVELIEEIAEQTNILALNASIEASRAGEASRGFAVVADEVQKLAERSSNATKKIEVLVSTIQSDTNEAVVSMERSTTDVVGGALLAENAGAALDEIEQVSHQIASLVQNISSSARDQSTVSTAINKNMQVLRQISAKTTESTAATSSAISKLSELASQLRRTVRGFRLPDSVAATGILTQAQVAESLARHGGDEGAVGGDDEGASPLERRKSG